MTASPLSGICRTFSTLLNAPQKHVWRARIVLLSAKGLGTTGIMRAIGKSRP
jgi:hypothetical protein